MKRILYGMAALALAGVLVLGVACDGDDDEDGGAETPVATEPSATEPAASDDEAAIEAVTDALQAFVEANNAADVEAYLALITDNFFGVFGFDKAAIRAAAEAGEFELGEPPINEFQTLDVSVSGDTATATASVLEGQGRTTYEIGLVNQAGSWVLDSIAAQPVDTPEGATEADLGLIEFAFNLTQLSFPAGDIAFQTSNDGAQPHELFIVKLPEGLSLQEALEAEEEPEGLEDVAFFLPILPGTSATWVVEDLEPGQYGYACFIPDADDPEGTPHAFKGMAGEFTVE